MAPEHSHGTLRLPGKLLDERALAHARLATNEGQPSRCAGRLPQMPRQLLELTLSFQEFHDAPSPPWAHLAARITSASRFDQSRSAPLQRIWVFLPSSARAGNAPSGSLGFAAAASAQRQPLEYARPIGAAGP